LISWAGLGVGQALLPCSLPTYEPANGEDSRYHSRAEIEQCGAPNIAGEMQICAIFANEPPSNAAQL
jgi:hypothetical protein